MRQRVIVGFDGSEHALAALTWAVAEARLSDSTLVALAVFDEVPSGARSESVNPPPAVLAELGDAVATVAQDFPVAFRYRAGDPAAVLIDECTASDLLVVGSRGRNPFAGLLLGSVSKACLALAPCPVTVVRPDAVPARSHGRVVVGVDASRPAQRALWMAAQEVSLRGGMLKTVHVLQESHGLKLAVPPDAHLDVRGDEVLPGNLADLSVAVQSVVVSGFPGDVLVQESKEADLLVVGSRGNGTVVGLLLGSTSDYCARYAACPVMVVRSDQTDQE